MTTEEEEKRTCEIFKQTLLEQCITVDYFREIIRDKIIRSEIGEVEDDALARMAAVISLQLKKLQTKS